MKAIILAAGYATRLYPLTINKPKSLLEINNKPIIENIIDKLDQIKEILEVIIISNDKYYENFVQWKKNFVCKKNIVILNDNSTDDSNKRGAIGDILFAIESTNLDDDVLIVAGDNYFTYDFYECMKSFKNLDKDCVIVRQVDNLEEIKNYAVVELDKFGKIISFEEKPSLPRSNTAAFAIYLYKKDTLKLVKEYLLQGGSKDAPGNFVQWLYKKKDVYGICLEGECYDIGTPQLYEYVSNKFKN